MRSRPIPWSPQEDQILKEAFADGLEDEEIVKLLPRRTLIAIEGRRGALKLSRRYRMDKTTKGTVKNYMRMQRDYRSFEPEVTPAAIAERDRAYNAPRTLGQSILGDPLPGRSYLDRKRAEEANTTQLKSRHPAWSPRAW